MAKVAPVTTLMQDFIDKATPTCITIKDTSGGKSHTGGVTFRQVCCTIGGKIVDGLYTSGIITDDIVIPFGIKAPDDPGWLKTGYPDSSRMSVKLAVSTSGIIGKFVEKFDEYWVSNMTTYTDASQPGGTKWPTGRINNHNITGLLERTRMPQSGPNKDKTIVLTDPQFKLRFSFDNFPERYPFRSLQGKQKSDIRDWRTRRLVPHTRPDGSVGHREEFDAAMVEVDGVNVPVNASNVHLFIRDSSIIKRIRVFINNASSSVAGGYSLPIEVQWIVIDPAPEFLEAVNDDSYEVDASEVAAFMATAKTVETSSDGTSASSDASAVTPAVTQADTSAVTQAVTQADTSAGNSGNPPLDSVIDDELAGLLG